MVFKDNNKIIEASEDAIIAINIPTDIILFDWYFELIFIIAVESDNELSDTKSIIVGMASVYNEIPGFPKNLVKIMRLNKPNTLIIKLETIKIKVLLMIFFFFVSTFK